MVAGFFIFAVITKIYITVDVVPKEVKKGVRAVANKVVPNNITVLQTTRAVPKVKVTTKKVIKVIRKRVKVADKSIRYTLGAFKEFLNNSVPAPMDHHDLTYLLHPAAICDEKMDLVIVVHSATKNKARRDVLRFTIGRYANKAKLKYKIFFVTGIPQEGSSTLTVDLLREHTEFSDLLVMDVVDSYRNMTYKAVSWMKWLTEYCEQKPSYIVKLDDDALLKLPLLIDMLAPCLRSKKGAICRQISCLVRPKEPSLRYGKNMIKYDEYPFRHYPPMCPGLMYLMPASFAERMLVATESVPFIWLDDVYVTVFLRVYINEQLNSLRRFFMQPHDRNYKQLYIRKMVAHLQSKTFVTDYIKIWNDMLDKYRPN